MNEKLHEKVVGLCKALPPEKRELLIRRLTLAKRISGMSNGELLRLKQFMDMPEDTDPIKFMMDIGAKYQTRLTVDGRQILVSMVCQRTGREYCFAKRIDETFSFVKFHGGLNHAVTEWLRLCLVKHEMEETDEQG